MDEGLKGTPGRVLLRAEFWILRQYPEQNAGEFPPSWQHVGRTGPLPLIFGNPTAAAYPAAIQEWARVAGFDASRATDQGLAVQTFMAIPYVVGSHDTVAAFLDGLAAYGVTGVCFIFPDYQSDLRRRIDHVLPLMRSRPQNSINVPRSVAAE